MDASDIKFGPAENKSCLNVCVDMLDKTGNTWRNNDAVVELRGVVGCLLLWLRGQVCQLPSITLGHALSPCRMVCISLVLLQRQASCRL